MGATAFSYLGIRTANIRHRRVPAGFVSAFIVSENVFSLKLMVFNSVFKATVIILTLHLYLSGRQGFP